MMKNKRKPILVGNWFGNLLLVVEKVKKIVTDSCW